MTIIAPHSEEPLKSRYVIASEVDSEQLNKEKYPNRFCISSSLLTSEEMMLRLRAAKCTIDPLDTQNILFHDES
jgi:hypothetical protein